MLLTTTNSLEIEGENCIEKYYGMVTGEAIIGANLFKDFYAAITDIVGGRSAAYEKSLRDAKNTAIQEMINVATSKGANAIIAVDLDYQAIGKDSSMLMVSASGTAVRTLVDLE